MTEDQTAEEVVEKGSLWNRSRNFRIGFFGWFVFNLVLFGLYLLGVNLIPLQSLWGQPGWLVRAYKLVTGAYPYVILIANIFVLIDLTIKRRLMAAGMIVAIGCFVTIVILVAGCGFVWIIAPFVYW